MQMSKSFVDVLRLGLPFGFFRQRNGADAVFGLVSFLPFSSRYVILEYTHVLSPNICIHFGNLIRDTVID